MSILLDALKKSEEQRQLGQAPSIHSPPGEAADRRGGGSQWVPLAMMSLAAVAMAWIGWQQLQPPVESSETAPAALAEGSETAGVSASAANVPAGEAQDEAAGKQVARRPQLVSSPAARTPVESLNAREDGRQSAKTPTANAAAKAERPRDGLSESVRDFAAAPDATESVAQTTQEESAPTTAGNPVVRQATDGQAGTTAAADPHATEPISFWELPQNVRDALPELRITVLVYADNPENRFVLIEGQRVVEKDRLSDGVVLEEIRRDGAVFEYRNYRFLVEG